MEVKVVLYGHEPMALYSSEIACGGISIRPHYRLVNHFFIASPQPATWSRFA